MTTSRERREQLRKAIEDYEYFKNYRKLNGVSIGAINVKENKTRGVVTADVTVYRLGEGSTRYNDCEYPLKDLKVVD